MVQTNSDSDSDRVEERLAPDRDVELDVRVRLGAARVELFVLLGRYRQQVPLGAAVVVVQVDAHRHLVQVIAVFRKVLWMSKRAVCESMSSDLQLNV